MPRIYFAPDEEPFQKGKRQVLTGAAARHVQVLRLQPADSLILFDGRGGQWQAKVERMSRSEVEVLLLAHEAVECELPVEITLALVVPANDRMDDLIEKATELGAANIQPLLSERSVLRLSGDRAIKKVAHWNAVAQAASEQCGRNRLAVVNPISHLQDWLQPSRVSAASHRYLLSVDPSAPTLQQRLTAQSSPHSIEFLSGPEGGFTGAETHAAIQLGYAPTSLGHRILRADTAPLAALAAIAVWLV